MTDAEINTKSCESKDCNCDLTLAFLTLRLFLGLRLIMAGVTKFERKGDWGMEPLKENMTQIANGIAQCSFFPTWMTTPYGIVLPWAMMVIGVGLLAGLKTRWMLIANALVYVSLGIGLMAVKEDQGSTNITVYVGVSALAFCLAKYNRFALLKD